MFLLFLYNNNYIHVHRNGCASGGIALPGDQLEHSVFALVFFGVFFAYNDSRYIQFVICSETIEQLRTATDRFKENYNIDIFETLLECLTVLEFNVLHLL